MATRLLPAAPNPFNPLTTLRFTLAESGPIHLFVVDQRGRRVRTLASGPWARGAHDVRWDGRDDRGRGVAAGTYLAVLDAPGRRHTEKMALVR
ncbi:MAG: FlgD immunoglobulin-like domain containing protein [Candidatus Krumholzibacteriia bacterium]